LQVFCLEASPHIGKHNPESKETKNQHRNPSDLDISIFERNKPVRKTMNMKYGRRINRIPRCHT